MPAAMHFSRSPCIASAVKAMMGTAGFPAPLERPDLASGSHPVHLGHLSINTMP
jgi:hypothetical protein